MNTSSDTKDHLFSTKKKRSKRNIQRSKKRAKWAKRSIDVAAVSSTRRLQEENENTFLKKIDEISIIDPANDDHNWSFNPHSPSFDSCAQLRAGSLQVPSQPNEEGFASHSVPVQPRIENGILPNGLSSVAELRVCSLQVPPQHNEEGIALHSALVQPRFENGLANDWSTGYYASAQPRIENGLANALRITNHSASVLPRIDNGLANDWSIDRYASVQPQFDNGLANDWSTGYYASVQPPIENGLANNWSIDRYASVQPRNENGLVLNQSTDRPALVQPRLENGLANDWSINCYASVQPRNENGLAPNWSTDRPASVQPLIDNGLTNGSATYQSASLQPRIENGLANDWTIDPYALVQHPNENGLARNLSADPRRLVNNPPIPVLGPVQPQPQPRNEPTINNHPIDRSEKSLAVKNRFNCNWSVNDCSFLMHEANLPTMDASREMAHQSINSHVPSVLSVLDKVPIKRKKAILPEGMQVEHLASPMERASTNDLVDHSQYIVASVPKMNGNDTFNWKLFLTETIALMKRSEYTHPLQSMCILDSISRLLEGSSRRIGCMYYRVFAGCIETL